jgi:hypothetical protein
METEKFTHLKSLGFSDAYLEAIQKFDSEMPQFNEVHLEGTSIKFDTISQEISFKSAPKTAFSNIFVKM